MKMNCHSTHSTIHYYNWSLKQKSGTWLNNNRYTYLWFFIKILVSFEKRVGNLYWNLGVFVQNFHLLHFCQMQLLKFYFLVAFYLLITCSMSFDCWLWFSLETCLGCFNSGGYSFSQLQMLQPSFEALLRLGHCCGWSKCRKKRATVIYFVTSLRFWKYFQYHY